MKTLLSERTSGSVVLVGAGPGDVELLTLKGRRVLEGADVVVYDRLIDPQVLGFAPSEAELIDVGKRGGCHPVPQAAIENLLIAKAKEGKRVVRLKGGDPFLFGRGAEEMAAMMEEGIRCELVPGVTSAIAVPAYAGIPVTHRDHASSVTIVTAHKRADGVCRPDPVDYASLAKLKGTLVFLMGVSELSGICAGLIAGGMDKDTPAAVVERGTTARQRRLISFLGELPERAAAAAIEAPAVVVVGKVAELSEVLDWRAALPLAGKRLLTTRSEGKNGRLAVLLRERGAEVLEIPCTRIEATDAFLPALNNYEWLGFTSTAGVERFFERLRAKRRDIREIGTAKVAAVGSMTAAAVEAHGVLVDLVPPVYSGACLGEELNRLAKGPLLLLRAERGGPELVQVLKGCGAVFDEVDLYRNVPISGSGELGHADAAVFASASAVRSFAGSYPEVRVKAVCIGEQTEKAARNAGYETHVARKATLKDLADAVEEVFMTC